MMGSRRHIARPATSCRVEAARHGDLPRSSDQATGNSLGVSNEYTRVLYRHRDLHLVPDHRQLDGRRGVVGRSPCLFTDMVPIST